MGLPTFWVFLHSVGVRASGLRWMALAQTLALVLLLGARASALEVPPLEGRVNDHAKLLSEQTRRSLTSMLARYEQKTGHQLAILTIPTLEGDPIEDFSMRVVEAWKLGRAKQDDGVLILVASNDRKMRIEVGYGLEGELPDIRAGRIVSDVMAPRFRQGDFDGGVAAAVRAVMDATGGAGIAPAQAPAPRTRRKRTDFVPVAFFALFFLLPLMLRSRRGRGFGGMIFWGGGFGGGGGFSGGGGGFSGGGGGFGGGGASG
ncbi:MAG: TPM domain-containing protein, partial [Polyangiaceae bacterium]|nr:TPM domain-containing protein [Polyangiaceae bacterium]